MTGCWRNNCKPLNKTMYKDNIFLYFSGKTGKAVTVCTSAQCWGQDMTRGNSCWLGAASKHPGDSNTAQTQTHVCCSDKIVCHSAKLINVWLICTPVCAGPGGSHVSCEWVAVRHVVKSLDPCSCKIQYYTELLHHQDHERYFRDAHLHQRKIWRTAFGGFHVCGAKHACEGKIPFALKRPIQQPTCKFQINSLD